MIVKAIDRVVRVCCESLLFTVSPEQSSADTIGLASSFHVRRHGDLLVSALPLLQW